MKPVLISLVCLALLRAPSAATDISTHSFGGCTLPDTNQSVSYTATYGEDHDYASSVSSMSFTIYNGVDWGGTATSSVTVDNRTGLMWLTNPGDAARGGTYTWLNALSACEGLTYSGFSDWRLPNVRELISIVDYGTTTAPSINTTAFPATASNYYWTSTTYVPSTTYAWYVAFNPNVMGNLGKTNSACIRCVRAGPP